MAPLLDVPLLCLIKDEEAEGGIIIDLGGFSCNTIFCCFDGTRFTLSLVGEGSEITNCGTFSLEALERVSEFWRCYLGWLRGDIPRGSGRKHLVELFPYLVKEGFF